MNQFNETVTRTSSQELPVLTMILLYHFGFFIVHPVLTMTCYTNMDFFAETEFHVHLPEAMSTGLQYLWTMD
jgi:hypothetical protein